MYNTIAEYDPTVSMTDTRSFEIHKDKFEWPCLSLAFYDRYGFRHLDEFPSDLTIFELVGTGESLLGYKTCQRGNLAKINQEK